MKDTKKILFLHHGSGIGGAPISMLETIESLDKSLYRAEVLLLKDSSVRNLLLRHGIDVTVADSFFYRKFYNFFPHIEPEYLKWWQIFSIFKLSIIWFFSRFFFSKQLLSKHSYDILHLNSSVLTDFLANGRRGGKVIIHVREPIAKGYLGLRYGIIKNQIRYYADSVIAISRDNASRLGCYDKTTVIYNFTDINRLSTPVLNLTKRVLYVGGDSFIKGYLTIVESLNYLHSDIKVLFCGHYKDVAKSISFRSLINRIYDMISPKNRSIARARKMMYNHHSSVVLGMRSDIATLMESCDVLVSPFAVEHFSRPVIEAFSNCRCAIGTDVDGMDELIDHDINGLIVRKNNPTDLADAINKICYDVELNMKMSLAAYEKAKILFSRDNIKQIQCIYAELLNNKK